MRLRIAIEVAEALSYLHSAASLLIYHRDIKSSNMLLDDKYRAKVADFEISKSVAIDQTHVTTQVQAHLGTWTRNTSSQANLPRRVMFIAMEWCLLTS